MQCSFISLLKASFRENRQGIVFKILGIQKGEVTQIVKDYCNIERFNSANSNAKLLKQKKLFT